MKEQPKTGDEVMLESGGAKMTIESIEGDDGTCVWIDKDGHPMRFTFGLATLRKV